MDRTFVDALNELMAGSSMSNNELARRVEIDSAQVGRWRKGLGLPRPENITGIAEVFNVDPGWLMSLAYPGSQSKHVAPANPRLAAFLSEVQTAWEELEQAQRDMAERVTRAAFGVQPTTPPSVNRQRRRYANRPADLEPRHGPSTNSGPDDPLIMRLHRPRRAGLAAARA